jgi:hypothetical protein
METEGSLPFSQVPAIVPYPEPDASNSEALCNISQQVAFFLL